MGTRVSFPGGKNGRGVKLHLHSPNTPSWHGVQLKHRDNFPLKLVKVEIRTVYQIRKACKWSGIKAPRIFNFGVTWR
jgi:hypothetical protein